MSQQTMHRTMPEFTEEEYNTIRKALLMAYRGKEDTAMQYNPRIAALAWKVWYNAATADLVS